MLNGKNGTQNGASGHLSVTKKLSIRLGRFQGFSINQLARIHAVSPKTVQNTMDKIKTAEDAKSITMDELGASITDKDLLRELTVIAERILTNGLAHTGISRPNGRSGNVTAP